MGFRTHWPLTHRQLLLLYLARRRAYEDPGPPSWWERFAATIAGLAMLAALAALAVLLGLILFAVVVALAS